jgi:hypothetical protein
VLPNKVARILEKYHYLAPEASNQLLQMGQSARQETQGAICPPT